MPQDGSNNYYYPPGTPGVPDTTIESEAYNNFLDDLVTNDLNIPRPIHRGGTGAATADTALVNLGAEKSNQIVTNYDSHVWMAGSFVSNAGATAAPTGGGGYSGTAYVSSINYITLVAIDYTTGDKFMRQKIAGSWGAWTPQPGSSAQLDTRYVNVAGDTMSGALIVTPKGNTFGGVGGTAANGAVTTADANILFYNGGATNWAGIGTDGNGHMWFKTGVTGTPIPAMFIDNTQFMSITKEPTSSQHVTSKFYVDTADTAVTTALTNAKVAKAGDTMTGTLYGTRAAMTVSGDSVCVNTTGTAGHNLELFATGGVSYIQSYNRPGGTSGGIVMDGLNWRMQVRGNPGTAIFEGPGNTTLKLHAITGQPIFEFIMNNAVTNSCSNNGSGFYISSNSALTAGAYLVNGSNSWSALSDARLAYKVSATPVNDVLSRLGGLQLFTNVLPTSGKQELFVKAQELFTSLPELVVEPAGPQSRAEEYVPTSLADVNAWGVTYDRAGVVALQAVKELLARVEALTARVAELENPT